eukprot:scaffold1929_cov376-Prasinococcus_capsulatus_cf.AAC.11
MVAFAMARRLGRPACTGLSLGALQCRCSLAAATFGRLSTQDAHVAAEPASGSSGSRTDFGFQDVPVESKAERVGEVFSRVAQKYDLMNDLMSSGMHRIWKDAFVRQLSPAADVVHLDVAGGTGDIAFRVLDAAMDATHSNKPLSEEEPTPPSVTVFDINPQMLAVGKSKAEQMQGGTGGQSGQDSFESSRRGSLQWVLGDAEKLPFANDSFDSYTIAFGIRNVTDKMAALREAHRVLRKALELKPSNAVARLTVTSQVPYPFLRQAYELYSFSVIPFLGQIVSGDRASYSYLVESIQRFPDAQEFKQMVEDSGLVKVNYRLLSGGIVAIHSGFKL